MSSILRLSSLASIRVLEVAEHLAVAGYGSRSTLAKDKSLLDRTAGRYRKFHQQNIRAWGYDDADPRDVFDYMMTVPRCGCPDWMPGSFGPEKRFEIDKHGRWQNYREGIRIHWAFSQIGTRASHTFRQPVAASIDFALRFWEQVSGLRFRLVEQRGESNISLIDGREDGPTNTLAWSLLVPKGFSPKDHLTHPRTGTTQLYDWDERWTDDASSSGIHLGLVAAHELFHACGFGHSADPADVMFPSYTPGRHLKPGKTEASVAATEYPGEPLRPDQPSPPTNPGTPKRGTVRLVNGMFSGDFEVIA